MPGETSNAARTAPTSSRRRVCRGVGGRRRCFNLKYPRLRHPEGAAGRADRNVLLGALEDDEGRHNHRSIASFTQTATERLRPPMSPTCQAATGAAVLAWSVVACWKALIGS